MFVSKILISSDFESIKAKMLSEYKPNSLRFIPKEPKDEFLIEDARMVEKESFIAENDEKIIIIMANSFRVEAQNFLLKLFEEPPKNIKFLIVVPSRNLLLPTIKSRLICEKQKVIKQDFTLSLNLKKLDLKAIFEFLKENDGLDKNDLLEKISLLARQSLKFKDLSEFELELFFKAYELARLNSKPSIIFTALLLNLYEKN